jgi:hypothetical protein
MAKIINLSHNLTEFNFVSPKDRLDQYQKAYTNHNLGKLDKMIPWSEIIRSFRKRGYGKKKKGPRGLFSLKGKIALMFVKSYLNGISDRALIDQLNRDIFLQFFCDVLIPIDEPLTNYKVVSAIRCELSSYLDIDAIQQGLIKKMRPHMEHPHIAHMDATVYESSIRYPTDVKILWESCEWLAKQNKFISRAIKVKNQRSKYKDIKKAVLQYQKSKKKTYKKTIRLRKRLLALLNKLIYFHMDLMDWQGVRRVDLPKGYGQRYRAILGVYCQQEHLLLGHKIADRIVSLDKPFLRPIIRGKEIKRVEFGAKVHMVQIDGMNFIEHLSFEPFNETTRLISAVHLVRRYTGKITHLAADNIYPTNKNRKYCSENNITTCFKRKGKAGKHETQRAQIQSILAKDRATRMEGSFGVEKNHYGLQRIRARTENTEKLWIFFGVHTANLVRLIHRLQQQQFKSLFKTG